MNGSCELVKSGSLVNARVGLAPVRNIRLRGLRVLENETMGHCAAVVDPSTVETMPSCNPLGFDRSSGHNQIFLPHEALTAFALHGASLHPMVARIGLIIGAVLPPIRLPSYVPNFREHSLEQGADGGRYEKPLITVNCALRKS